MMYNCEKCHFVWESVGFMDKNGIPLESTYRCSKCGHVNGRKLQLDRFKELTGDKNAQLFD